MPKKSPQCHNSSVRGSPYEKKVSSVGEAAPHMDPIFSYAAGILRGPQKG